MNEVGIDFFSIRTYVCHFEYIEVGSKIMFLKIWLDKSRFSLVLHCLAGSAEAHKYMKLVFGIHRICSENSL